MFAVTSCPRCNRHLEIEDHVLGRTVACPACAARFLATLHPTRPSRLSEEDDEYDPRMDALPHRASLVLILGLLGLASGGILAPLAWLMGANDLQAMNSGHMDIAGEPMTRQGRDYGIVGTALLGLIGTAVLAIVTLFAMSTP